MSRCLRWWVGIWDCVYFICVYLVFLGVCIWYLGCVYFVDDKVADMLVDTEVDKEDDKVADMLVDTEVDNVVDEVANLVGYQLEGYHLEFGPGRSLDI